MGLIDGIIWGIAPSLGGLSLGLVALSGAAVVVAIEAIGLPRPLARIARLGIRNAERDYDRQLWRLVGAGWQPMPVPVSLGDGWGGDAVTDGQRLYLVSRGACPTRRPSSLPPQSSACS